MSVLSAVLNVIVFK